MAADPDPVTVELDALHARLEHTAGTKIGFPDAHDIDYSPLRPFDQFLLNNIGDPATDGAYPHHTKPFERQVITAIADLLRAPADDRWGYVTSGATEGSEYALLAARRRYPDAIVYHSEATHFAVLAIIDRLRMESITVRCDGAETMAYEDLRDQVGRHRNRPAIVIANAGTGIREAVDDVGEITTTLDGIAVRHRFIHVDAALSGIPLALIDPQHRPGFDFADGADSIIVSGHKFLGTPMPCGVVIVKAGHRGYPRTPTYTGSADTTVNNSRDGHAALALWYVLHTTGAQGLRQRADNARATAAYAVQRLNEIGWQATRNPHAMTVVIPAPPPAVTQRWSLPVQNGLSHIVCVPGVTHDMIDAFVQDLAACHSVEPPGNAVEVVQAEPATSNQRTARTRWRRAPAQLPRTDTSVATAATTSGRLLQPDGSGHSPAAAKRN